MPPQKRKNFSQRQTNIRTSTNISKKPIYNLNNLNRVKNTFSNIGKLAVRTGQLASKSRRFLPNEINKNIRLREQLKIKREEIKRIREELARMMNVNPNKLGKDRKIEVIAMSLHSIYGPKISKEKLRQINNMLMQEFSPNSPFLKQSPTIRKLLVNAEVGHIGTKKNARGYSEVDVLTQAISDLMEQHEMM